MEPRICINCGAELDPEDDVCPECDSDEFDDEYEWEDIGCSAPSD
jgi:RNA polymerase subunit RPABC4/transcription elongation factor Spt4